jgi:hypothetical protein
VAKSYEKQPCKTKQKRKWNRWHTIARIRATNQKRIVGCLFVWFFFLFVCFFFCSIVGLDGYQHGILTTGLLYALKMYNVWEKKKKKKKKRDIVMNCLELHSRAIASDVEG